ncbi:MAG: hypothetical protein EOL95_07105 [Bacteroidia bacterium]|nr:hypothetical protein [Bacteroidia bacterium]
MGLYERIKDVAKQIQKTGNTELYGQLIELGAEALDMQNEIVSLSAENTELKKMKDIENRIERHTEPYITLKDAPSQILYCSHCWDYEEKLIQVKCYDSGSFKCTHCENNGTYDTVKYEEYLQRERAAFRNLSESNRRNRW